MPGARAACALANLLDGAVRGAVHFPRRVIALFTEAVHVRDRYRAAAPGSRSSLGH